MPNLEPFENGEDFGGIPFLDKPNWNPSTFNWLRRVIHIWYARWHAKMSGSMLYSHCWSSVDHGHHFVSFIPLFYGAQFSVVNIIWLVVWNIFFHILEIITPTDELNSIIFQGVGWNHQPVMEIHRKCWISLDLTGFDYEKSLVLMAQIACRRWEDHEPRMVALLVGGEMSGRCLSVIQWFIWLVVWKKDVALWWIYYYSNLLC